MPRILILDDDQDRHDDFARRFATWTREHVYTVAGFEDAIRHRFDVVHFDHDLGDYQLGMYGIDHERTGVDAAKLLVAARWKPSFAVVHSWNPEGAQRILRVLRSAGITAFVIPFTFGRDDNYIVMEEDHADDQSAGETGT